MREYARQRGPRRWMIRVPVLTPRLSSLWRGFVTPLYARVGRKLIESIKHPTVVRDRAALEVFSVRPQGMREAIAAAIRSEEREIAESRWFDAFSSGGEARSWAGVRFGNRLVDSRSVTVDVGPDEAFAPIRRIGGETGWYAYDWLWRLRGFLDLSWSAAWACAAGGPRPTSCTWATRSTSGASRPTSPTGSCASTPR